VDGIVSPSRVCSTLLRPHQRSSSYTEVADNSAREFDPTPMINYSNDSFVAVIIQYRLGAFGFLNSPQMASAGGLNAGITDAQVALEWVQQYIHLFGGDKDQVTIWGQSSGGGTILHLLAAQAEQGRKNLWRSAVVSSPYLTPMGACDSSFWQVRRSVSPCKFYFNHFNLTCC
jgi:carboxylesterase type B